MRLRGFVLGLVTIAGVVSARPPRKRADTKYFHEPGISHATGHYDARFFGGVVDYDTRSDTLKHLVKSWLQMTQQEGIETWIAHGTLLGWWWNAKILPWDWDLDVQVSAGTLNTLGEKYNQTTHKYKSEDGVVEREYFLDVNEWIWQRVRGDGQNVIDARWVDTRNGLYIDITGIAETDPVGSPGILHCKNYHRYHYDDVWPLRDTLFEGVPAKIPYGFDEILIKEYHPKALVVTEYEGHRWNTHTKLWEPASDVPASERGQLPPNSAQIPEKYSSVETGSVIYNLFRLVHWWD